MREKVGVEKRRGLYLGSSQRNTKRAFLLTGRGGKVQLSNNKSPKERREGKKEKRNSRR